MRGRIFNNKLRIMMGEEEEIKIKYKIKWSDQLRVAMGLTEKIRLVRRMGRRVDSLWLMAYGGFRAIK